MCGDLLADASRVVHPFLGRNSYAIAYGSHARGATGPRSDLDLLVVGPTPLGHADRDRLIDAVRQLHHRHGLKVDEEVSYAVKLYASIPEVIAALAFDGFAVNASGDLSVPPVVAAPGFLNSRPFKLRLIVNALTSPHVFLGGDAERHTADHVRACRTVALLALSILADHEVVTAAQAVDVLIADPRDGATGEDYLGYRAGADVPAVYGLVQRGFAHLVRWGALQRIDGARFAQRPNVRRSLALVSATRQRCPPGGIRRIVEQRARYAAQAESITGSDRNERKTFG